MAKKPQVEAGANKGHEPVQTKAVPGTKKKRCPMCETEQGNAAKTCRHCSVQFVMNSARPSKATNSAPSTSLPGPSVERILRFIVKSGTVDDAIASLEKVQTDPAMSFAVLFGSVDKAIAAVKREAKRE